MQFRDDFLALQSPDPVIHVGTVRKAVELRARRTHRPLRTMMTSEVPTRCRSSGACM